MNTCPEGHRTASTDYCDICGTPMTPPRAQAASAAPAPGTGSAGVGGAGPVAPQPQPPEAPAAPATQACPHCGATNGVDNLFCEVCGFDFTTGVMPRIEGPSFLPPVPATPAPAEREPGPGSRAEEAPGQADDAALAHEVSPTPSAAGSDGPAGPQAPRPAASVPDEAVIDAADAEPIAVAEEPSLASPDRPLAEVPAPPDRSGAEGAWADEQGRSAHVASGHRTQEREAADPAPDEPAAGSVRSATRPVHRPPSRQVAGDWVVEVWIDPEWFAVQDTGEEFPSVAPPEIVRLTSSDAVIGRRSRTAVPDVDCGLDSAVSRRQALLTSDGRRWWIEDLDSSNGTWVGPAIGPLPSEPISGRTEVDADDRIYVGAWTRLVVRPAAPSEVV